MFGTTRYRLTFFNEFDRCFCEHTWFTKSDEGENILIDFLYG